MEIIELWNGTTKALIDPMGAWLTNLSDDNGDILFPKRQLSAPDGSRKARGGCHVCLPNFGPGGESGLAQHGFGRTTLWDVANVTESSVVLTLSGGSDDYKSLKSVLTYELGQDSITIKLELKNDGDTPLRVAPGFHPYFSLFPDEGRVKITDESYDLPDLAGTLYRDSLSQQLVTTKRTFNLVSDNLPTWAIWTDQLAPYVCVEPNFAGPTFVSSEPANKELLVGGGSNVYVFSASW